MPSKRKVQKVLKDIIHEQRPKKLPRDHAPTTQEKLQAMLQTKKGKQMVEESPIYEMKDGKEKLVKSRTGPRRSVSFSIGKQDWKENKGEK